MNQLSGIVQGIKADQDISIVEINVEDTLFSALTVEKNVIIGDNVIMGFKETVMSIGKHLSGELSIHNRLDLVIGSLTMSEILTKVIFDFRGHELISVITTASAQRLQLDVDDHVEGLVKTTDMIFMKK